MFSIFKHRDRGPARRASRPAGWAATSTRYALALLPFLVATPEAAGYALNAHVAICQHVLDTLGRGSSSWSKLGVPDLTPRRANVHDNRSPDPTKGVKRGRPGSGSFAAIRPNAAIKRIVLAHPAAFRAGCGAPDAFPFFGNTDPSHSYGWDPVGIAEALLKNAKTGAEKSWVYGYFAHLAMDGAVHAFANTYAAFSMKKRGKLPGVVRPQVWNTFVPSNFLAHVASETWLNRFFIYAAKPQNYKIETPADFARRMFLTPGSPIVRHFSRLLSVWSAESQRRLGRKFDLQTQFSGKKPGVLGTSFHRALEHLHKFEELHTKQMYKWRGHTNFYEKKTGPTDRFKYYLSATFHAWHKGRVGKIREIYRAWLKATIDLQTVVSARGGAKGIAKALLPFHKAVSAYLSIGLVDALRLPPTMQKALDTFRAILSSIQAVVKTIVVTIVTELIQPFIHQIEELAQVAMGHLLDKYMDRKARDHARKQLAAAGLVGRVADSEPFAKAATRGGIDGGSSANRKKLLRYPFYRNAWMAVFHILRDPLSLRQLPSADFTNGARCADFFQKTRRHAGEQFTAIVKADDPLYNATTETCHTPKLTQLTDAQYRVVDFDKKYAHLAKKSKGFAELKALDSLVRTLHDAAKKAGSWLWDKLKQILPERVTSALSFLGKALAAVGAALVAVVTGPPGSAGQKVKAFVLHLVNGFLPTWTFCVPDAEISKTYLTGLRPIRTCELAEAFLKERCTGPFLNTLIAGALPIYARPAEMNLIKDRGVVRALKGIQIALDKVHVVVPAGDNHRPSVQLQISLSKDGEKKAMRFGATVAARIETKCGKRESAFRLRPFIDDFSLNFPPGWLLKTAAKVALRSIKFDGWRPSLNRWWSTTPRAEKSPAPPAPKQPARQCEVSFEGGNR